MLPTRTPGVNCGVLWSFFQGASRFAADSKLEVRSSARRMRSATGSGRWEQAFCFLNAMQGFPGGLGQGRVRAYNVPDHLPGGEVERALRRGPIAKETEHCGQKQMRCAEDFWRGLTPTVCANR